VKKISVIIPCLNEAASISDCLASLQSFKERGHEIIVVDGGSKDETLSLAEEKSDFVLSAPRGRASQLNFGAKKAKGCLLLFLHADTLLAEGMEVQLEEAAEKNLAWGRFDVRFSSAEPLLRIVEFFMNTRSRLTGIATGDQAMFVTRQLFERAGGFPKIALMEDIAFSKKLKNFCRPICYRNKVLTSSRRWQRLGIIRTILNMWSLRLRYTLGTSPEKLAKEYE
jgi:rSAM/selenodomain-associated transferase 2